MKQKLIALLKTSFASKGFNAKELDSLADLLIAQNVITETSTDEDLATAVTGAAPVADFVQSVASRQVSDAVKPKPVEPVTVPVAPVVPVVDPNEDPTAKALRLIMEKLEKQEQTISQMGSEKVATTRREQVLKKLEGVPDAIKADKLADFDVMSFKDDETFNGYLTRTEATAKVIVQEAANGGLGGDRPNGGFNTAPLGGKKEASAAEVDAVIDSII